MGHGFDDPSAHLLRAVRQWLRRVRRQAIRAPSASVQHNVVILVGQFVDLFWLIIPEMPEGSACPWWQTLGATAFMIGVLIIGFGRFISRNNAVASGDPLLEESCNFRL